MNKLNRNILLCFALGGILFTPQFLLSQDEEEVLTLDIYEVSTDTDVGYVAHHAVGALRMDNALADTPMNITVYNQEFIEDTASAAIGKFTKVIQFDGTITNVGPPNSAGTLMSRGFRMGVDFLNGVAQTRGQGDFPYPNIERIEVIKGPMAVLYGTSNYGGMVNRVTKKPLSEARTSWRFVFGINEHNTKNIWRMDIDFGGPMDFVPFVNGLGGKFSHRTNFVWENSGLDREVGGIFNLEFATTLRWEISTRTRVDLMVIGARQKNTPSWEHPTQIDANGNVIFGFLDLQGNKQEWCSCLQKFPDQDIHARKSNTLLVSLDFFHRINGNMTFRSQNVINDFSATNNEFFPVQDTQLVLVDPDHLVVVPPGGGHLAGTGLEQTFFTDGSLAPFTFPNGVRGTDLITTRRIRNINRGLQRFETRNELTWEMMTGPAQHKWLFGFSYFTFTDDFIRAERRPKAVAPGTVIRESDIIRVTDGSDADPDVIASGTFFDWQLVSAFNYNNDHWFGGNHDNVPFPFPQLSTFVIDRTRDIANTTFYVNDLVSFSDRFFINWGFRWQDFDEADERRNSDGTPQRFTTRTSDAQTFSVGAVFHIDPAKQFSVFFNRNTSFEPVFTQSADGFSLPHIEGNQIEAGLKWELFDGHFAGTFSYFDIQRDNIPRPAPNTTEPGVLRPAKGETSDGFEISLTAAPFPGFQVVAGYTDVNATDASGDAINNVAENNFAIFGSFKPKEGALKDWMLTLGANKRGDQFTDDRGNRALRWTMVGKWLMDASISKSFNIGGARYKLTVHGENILNEDKQLAKARWWDTSVQGLRKYRVIIQGTF